MELDKQIALNEKLAKWVGFRQLPKGKKNFHYERGVKVMGWMPPKSSEWYFAQRHPPNFVDSLDECFEWLVPKDYQQIIFQPDGYCGLTVDDKLYEGSGDTPALAVCKAIEKLIDKEVTHVPDEEAILARQAIEDDVAEQIENLEIGGS